MRLCSIAFLSIFAPTEYIHILQTDLPPLIPSVVDDEFRKDYATQSQEGHGFSEGPQRSSKLKTKEFRFL